MVWWIIVINLITCIMIRVLKIRPGWKMDDFVIFLVLECDNGLLNFGQFLMKSRLIIANFNHILRITDLMKLFLFPVFQFVSKLF